MAFATDGSGQHSSHALLRVLGTDFGIAVGLGTMIGAGILRTPGSVLDEVPIGWLALLLWLAAGVHALLGANIIAEVMAAIPRSGGIFNVAKAAFGEFGAVLVGWTDLLIAIAAMAALAIASGEFLAMVLPTLKPVTAYVGATVAIGLFALNWLGVREGSRTQIAVSAIKATLLIGLIILIFVQPIGASAFAEIPQSNTSLTFFGVVVAYQLIVGAYSGWPNSVYFAEETLDPGRDIPKSLFVSILSVMGIYLLMNAALLYSLPIDQLRQQELPLSLAVSNIFGPTSIKVIAAVAFVSVVGALNGNIMSSARTLHALARDHYLPGVAARVNSGGTPDVALFMIGVATVLLALTGKFETVFLIMGALGMFIFALLDVAFFKLRLLRPDLSRPFRAVGYPFLPAIVLVLDSALLVAFLAADMASAAFMILGVAVCIPMSVMAKHRKAGLAVTSA